MQGRASGGGGVAVGWRRGGVAIGWRRGGVAIGWRRGGDGEGRLQLGIGGLGVMGVMGAEISFFFWLLSLS
jgi:hypothetical protein